MGKLAEQRVFDLEDLTVTPSQTSEKSNQKTGPKVALQRREIFAQVSATQINLLAGASRVTTVTVFHYLLMKSFKVYHRAFVLPNDGLAGACISRHSLLRALRDLARLGLITIERDGPRKPPRISIVGVTKQG